MNLTGFTFLRTLINFCHEKIFRAFFLTLSTALGLNAQSSSIDSLFPVRGICLEAPMPADVDAFVTFINKEIASRGVNTLILRIDYRYQFESHAELIDTMPLSRADMKKIVTVCKENNIRLIPQINLLGHQSWESHTGK